MIITAEEARTLVEKSIKESKEAKLKYVFERIQEAAKIQKYDLRLNNIVLEPDQIEVLKEHGYRVEQYVVDHGYQKILYIVWKDERE